MRECECECECIDLVPIFYAPSCACVQVCINAAVDTLFCDERLEVPVGSWELVHIDVFERLMDKLGPRFLSSVLFQTHLLFATPYNATLMNTPGMPCVFANSRSHRKSFTRPERKT